MGKCALIVDDSRTSRAVLQRILETHDLAVDTAGSAESALDYLTENRPDVIFMDHLMPGMDGFEAVTAIKRNPDTATIPIMMYTSQKGDVYVGQARALGAVGVLPKEVEPVEVSKVLESLHIVGDQPPPAEVPEVDQDEITSDEYPILANLDQDMRLMLEDLFDQQRAILKRDLIKSSDRIAARIADRLTPVAGGEPSVKSDGEPRRTPVWTVAVMAVLAVTVAVMSIFLYRLNSRLQNSVSDNATLADSMNRQWQQSEGARESLMRELNEYRQAVDATRAATLDAIAWAINRSGYYAFGELPLGDGRVADFEELIAHLQTIDFVGQVVVEIHVGEHCLSLGPNGYELADPRITADACDLRGLNADTGLELGRQQSVAMANLMNSAPIRTDGAIRFLVVPRGSEQPLQPYPVNAFTATAGEWNAAADANNRIEIALLPDAVTP